MRSPQKNLALHISTLIVVTACFVVMGSSFLVSQNLKSLLTMWGDDIQLTVYLSEDIDEAQQGNVQTFIKSQPEVKQITVINQEKALNDFRLQLASYAPDLAQDDELLKLIPSSLQVALRSELSSTEQVAAIRRIADQVKGLNGVDEVSYGQDWVEKYSALVNALHLIVQGLGLVILFASMFVMSNAIRASIEGRRPEISVLELIGATSSMIRRPFLVEGAVLGGVSSLLSMAICFGIFSFIKEFFIQKLSFLQLGNHLAFLHIGTVVAFIVGGTLLGALGSYLCVRRINDGWAARAG